MDTWDAIRARRDTRRYTDEPIAKDDLDRILEAGRRTPSSQNQQRWDFVVVTDRDRLKELANVWRGAGHVAESAATVALVAPDAADARQRESIQYDLGQVTTQLMLAATDLGIGSAHASVTDQDLARRLLGFPDDRFCAWLVVLGHPAEGPLRPIRNPARRDFDDVIHREEW